MLRTILYTVLILIPFLAAGQNDGWSEDQIKIQTHITKASGFKLQGSVEKAIEEYKKAIAVNTNVPVAWYELARLEHAQGQNEVALQSINKSINLDQENRWYALFKIDLLQKMYRTEEAIGALQDFVNRNGEEQDLVEQLAHLQMTSGKTKDAIASYQRLESNYGVREDWTRKKYNLLLELNQRDAALQELQALSLIYPDNTDYLMLISEHYTYAGEESEARKLYERILKIDPSHPKANLALAQINTDTPGGTKFIQNIQPVLEDARVSIDVKMREIIPALEALTQNYEEGAAQDLLLASRTLLKVHPEEAKAHALRADVLNACGRYGEAADEYAETIKRQKNVLAVWEQYLEVLQMLRRDDELIEVVDQALNVFPNQGILAYFEAYGAVQKIETVSGPVSLRRAELLNRRDPMRLALFQLLNVEQSIRLKRFDEKMVEPLLSKDGTSNLVIGRIIQSFWEMGEQDEAKKYSRTSRSVWNALALSETDPIQALELVSPYAAEVAGHPIFKDLFLYLQNLSDSDLNTDYLEQLKDWRYQYLFYSLYD